MVLYRYQKKIPDSNCQASARMPSLILRIFPVFLIILGLGLFISAAYPVFSYQFFTTSRFRVKFLNPLAETIDSPNNKAAVKDQDLTLISNWFPEAPKQTRPSTKITHYTLSIPKLKIIDATVTIGNENLKKSLIQYGGTALPGEPGNTVVFGHSVLPQFFNPKNYMTIFSLLPTLKEGDEIIINFDGIEYKYRIFKMTEVSHTDVSILEQRYDNAYLTLVTCVPPGTYWKRLAVRAKLERI